MFPELLKPTMRKLFDAMGIEVYRRDSRSSLLGVLRAAKKAGLLPGTGLGVGAAFASFVSQCCKVFPDARFLCIEPLQEYQPLFEKVTKTIPNVEYILAAAASENSVGFWRSSYLFGCSVSRQGIV